MGDLAASKPGGDPPQEDDGDPIQPASMDPPNDASSMEVCEATMEKPLASYRTKLMTNTQRQGEGGNWPEEEEEVTVEPGDIIIGCEGNLPSLDLSIAFQKRLEKRWEQSVIVKLLGKNISYRVLTARLKSLWQPSAPFKLIDLENNFYVVKFQNKQDYLHSLVDGPWSIFNSALCVFPWTSDFCAASGKVEKAVVWVRFPDIPLHTYHPSILNALGDLVGESIRIDQATREYQRGRFAKIAVEVDLTKPLKGTILFRGKEKAVIYEGLPTLCYSCGSADHTMDKCPLLSQSAEGSNPVTSQTSPERTGMMNEEIHAKISGGGSSGAGPWMNAPVRARRNPQRKAPIPKVAPMVSNAQPSGSRFEVLATDLDRQGGVEDDREEGLGPWIVVAEKREPKPKPKRITKKDIQPTQQRTTSPGPSNPQVQTRTPLAEVTNADLNTTSQTHWVIKSPLSDPTSANKQLNRPAQTHNPTLNIPDQPQTQPITKQTNKPTYSTNQHSAIPSLVTPLNQVLSKEEAEEIAEMSRVLPESSTSNTSPLSRTRPKSQPPDLNPIDVAETHSPPGPSSSKNSKLGMSLKRSTTPSFKRRGQKGGLGPISEDEETLLLHEEMQSMELEPLSQQSNAHLQGNLPPNF
ncbi:hypothetical protein Tsubulata_004822 [Turnera subulata]|uniref:CCHC-type domain-containing protein n=1 Tax=Turnera subulata TaxID=218843 RepID=A0A9Q0FEA3_9ROSI|nr:hypothetical protein Tsubulata_004822 [Turnera subulata]